MTTDATIDAERGETTFACRSPRDQLLLKGRIWPATGGPPRAVVLIAHGFGEHCQRYRWMAHFLNAHQMACVAFDWRGHGESEGERGFVPSLDALHDDIECIISRIKRSLYPRIPLVIYAHGTGSMTCLGHVLRRRNKPLDCQAMIISTPPLCLRSRPKRSLLFMARAFAHLDPYFRLPVEGNYTNTYTNDPRVVDAYRRDPLVHDRWPAITVSVFMELARFLERNTIRATWPLLIQHGASDTITPIKGIRQWVRHRVKCNSEFKEWPSNYHEIHNDLNKEEVLDYLVRWIKINLNIP
jgi:acylglycerol lipase